MKTEKYETASELPPIEWGGSKALPRWQAVSVFTPEAGIYKNLAERADMMVEHLKELPQSERGANIYVTVYHFVISNFPSGTHVFFATWLTILITQKAERAGIEI